MKKTGMFLTHKHLIEMENQGRNFRIYPRKLQVAVDDCKLYETSVGAINLYTHWKETGFLINPYGPWG